MIVLFLKLTSENVEIKSEERKNIKIFHRRLINL